MVLVGDWKGVNGPGKDAIIRMTYSKNADGSVRQHGEQSTDHGLTWSTNFDFTYHPKANPRPDAKLGISRRPAFENSRPASP